jgi:curli biogenesis system outer membrane secretion channel CsgG
MPYQANTPFKRLSAIAFLLAASTGFAQSNVEKCNNNFGTVSVIEAPQGYGYLSSYGLGSPSALLRLMIQQSGCFDVVERGRALNSLQQERNLAGSGEFQDGSNVGKGQMQAADFVMTPDIQVTGNTGGIGAVVGGLGRLFGGVGAAIGAVAGGLKFKEAQTSILISDVRSGIQVAAAEGTAKKTDFNIGGWGYGAGTWGGGGGYTNTPEGKMISASLLDNYNNVVIQIRDKTQLIRPRSASSAANAAASIQASNSAPAPQPLRQAAPMPSPASQQYAPNPMGTMGSSTVPIEYTGQFKCLLTGQDQGRITLSVARNGTIHGIGLMMQGGGSLQVMGDVDQTGNVAAIASNAMGGGSLTGMFDNSGKLTGTWKVGNASAPSGTFSCLR